MKKAYSVLRKEKYALPRLGLLSSLADGKIVPEMVQDFKHRNG